MLFWFLFCILPLTVGFSYTVYWQQKKQWQRMIYWMLWARCGRQKVPGAIDYHPDTPCSQSQLAALAGGTSVPATTDIDPCQFTWYDNGVEKTTQYPEYSLPTNGTNYVWNYRMRRAMPELIATSNPGATFVTSNASSNSGNIHTEHHHAMLIGDNNINRAAVNVYGYA